MFSRRQIEAAVSPERAVEAVREAFVAYARGEWSMPPKVYVPAYPAGDFRAMPASGGGHTLLKWVSSFPGNPAQGLPTVSGTVLVSDAANGPYPQLKEMAEANPEFPRTDVALVIGANDVVNPDARSNAGSPIYGMPILNVDDSQTVVVLKRSMNPGFAGIDNPLFLNPKTVMLFGDAKDSVAKLIAGVKAL